MAMSIVDCRVCSYGNICKQELLGSDPAWVLSDTKLSSEDLWLARQRAASEQESETGTGRDLLKERRD
jgi:hypothetical protein